MIGDLVQAVPFWVWPAMMVAGFGAALLARTHTNEKDRS